MSKNNIKGIVFDIQKFCLQDGPGIRTTVFLKGCQLRCAWCHNPESFDKRPQLSYNPDKCMLCRKCEICDNGVHNFSNESHNVFYEKCAACGKCVNVCLYEAIKIIGSEMSATEVIAEVLKDKKYYDSSCGGVTFSGGEATYQYDFLLELLKMSKENHLHVCLETNGVIDKERLKSLFDYVDIFLYDYKAADFDKHKHYTGAGNELIISNIELLHESKIPVILRCPIIEGINDDDNHFDSILKIKNKYSNIIKTEVMPYHNIGEFKWSNIGLEYSLKGMKSATNEQKELWSKKLEANI